MLQSCRVVSPIVLCFNSAGSRLFYCIKWPHGKISAGPFLGEKETVETKSAGAAKMWREPPGRQFDGGFPVLPNMQNPDDTCLPAPGILALLAFPQGKHCAPQGKTGRLPVFYKMEGRENSLPGTELFDCADLYASIQGSDDRSQNRERFCFLRVLMTQNPVKGHLKSDRDILSLSSKFAVWISAAYLPVSSEVWNIVPNS